MSVRSIAAAVAFCTLSATGIAAAEPNLPHVRRTVAGSERQAYFEIAPRTVAGRDGGAGDPLLIVLPGGSGSADFLPFVKRIAANAVPKDFRVVQPIAVRWTDDQKVVWPTERLKVEGQRFSTEDFVRAVVADVASRSKLDERRVFAMGWSSSGPAVYSLALAEKTPLTGAYVLQSVYKPATLPPIANAKRRAIAIEHGRADRVCPFAMAEDAAKDWKAAGGLVNFTPHNGGHGFRGAVYPRMKAAIERLNLMSARPR